MWLKCSCRFAFCPSLLTCYSYVLYANAALNAWHSHSDPVHPPFGDFLRNVFLSISGLHISWTFTSPQRIKTPATLAWFWLEAQ